MAPARRTKWQRALWVLLSWLVASAGATMAFDGFPSARARDVRPTVPVPAEQQRAPEPQPAPHAPADRSGANNTHEVVPT